MNMISTGAFLTEMDASNKQPTVAEKFAAVWEKKNAKAARAGGVSLMALSLAACGGSSSTTTTTTTTDTTTTTPVGQAFVLASTADVITGTAGDDTVSGTSGSIDGDTINAGAGDDTLSITVSVADDDLASFAASGLETLQVRGTGAAAGEVDLDLGDVAGLETLEFRRMAEDVIITNVQSLDTGLKISDTANAASTVVVSFDASAVTGTADTASLTVDNNTAGQDFTVNGVETIAVTAVGEDNDINIDGDDLEAVTVAGSGDISIDVDASVTAFTSTATGDVTMVATAAADVTATGGAGADTFSMGITLTADDAIDGGEGSDTLVVNNTDGNALTVIPASADVTGVETLRIEATDDSAVDAFTLDANVVSFDAITIDVSDENDTYTITDYTAETLSIVESANNAIDLINVSLVDATGAADSLTINVTNSDATTAFTVDDINSTGGGIETLNLVLNQGVDIEDASDITVDDISSTHDTLNVSGDADVTFGADAGITTAEIVSTSTGDIDLTVGASTADITLGAGDDTVTFEAAAYTSADTVDTGDGTDTLETGNLAAGVNAATVSGAETVLANFGTASATLSMLNTTGTTTVAMQGAEAHRVSNLKAENATVQIASTDADGGETVNLTWATSTDSAHTVVIGDVADGTANADVDVDTITIAGNEGALTITSDGETGNSTDAITANAATGLTISTVEDLEIDSADGGADGRISATAATSVSVVTAGGDLLVDDTSNFSAATTISVNVADEDDSVTFTGAQTATAATSYTVTAEGNFDQTGNFVSDADIAVTLTANDVGDIRFNGILDVDHVTTLTATATDGGVILIDDIELLGVDADGDDITSTVALSATGTDASDNGSSVTVSAINVASATTLDSLTVTTDADGTVDLTIGGALLTITSIDASASAGDFTLDGSAVAAALDIDLGSGTNDLTLEEGLAHTVTMASAAGTDTVNYGDDNEGTSAAMVITNFEAGTGGDVISLDVSDIDGTGAVGAENELGTSLGVSTAVIMQVDADGTFTADTGASLFKLTDTFSAVSDVVTALSGNMTGFATTDNATILVLWTDGADTYLSSVTDNGGNAAAVDGGENLIQFVGVAIGDATDGLTAANFEFV